MGHVWLSSINYICSSYWSLYATWDHELCFPAPSSLWASVALPLWLKISSLPRSMWFTCFPWARNWAPDSDRAWLRLWLLSGTHRKNVNVTETETQTVSLKVFPNISAGGLTWTNMKDFWKDLLLGFSRFGSEIATWRLGPHKFSEIQPMLWGGNVWLPCQDSEMKILDGVPGDVALWHWCRRLWRCRFCF